MRNDTDLQEQSDDSIELERASDGMTSPTDADATADIDTEPAAANDTDALLLPAPKHCVKCKDKREYVQLACLLGCVQLCCRDIELGARDSVMLGDDEPCLCPKVRAACESQQQQQSQSQSQSHTRVSQLKRALERRWRWLALLATVAVSLALWLGHRAEQPPPSVATELVPTTFSDSLDALVNTSASPATAVATTHFSIPFRPDALPTFVPSVPLHSDAETERAMDIYCRGPILHAVQMANVFADSKHFVDMPIKANSSAFDIIVDFERRHLATTEFRPQGHWRLHAVQLRRFVDDHFDPPGSELTPITPVDYQELTVPPRIASIEDVALRDWAFELHRLWRTLGRVPTAHVRSSYLHAKPIDNPVLHRPQNILIVPGGRFRESYYWDSYWIVEGLLVSGMERTARGVVNNLLEYVDEFGFVPNGGRIYYLTRSQPPMLSDMVRVVAQSWTNASTTNDSDTGTDTGTAEPVYDAAYLNATVPILEKEYAFWMQLGPCGRAVEFVRPARDGSSRNVTHILNRYTSSANHPRPESYREDVDVAAEIYGDTVGSTSVESLKDMYYNDIIAAAESGWDFSSRWLRDSQDIKSVATSTVVPVDLNAILHRVETNLATFYAVLGNVNRTQFFQDAAHRRVAAMDEVLWNDTLSTWKDYNMERACHATIASVSDYAPLWAGAFNASDRARLERVVRSLQDSGLLQVGGVLTTTVRTGQQWDAPNAWAPTQDMVVEGLLAVNTRKAQALARDVVRTWVKAGYVAWKQTGLMFEKYNATEVGGLGVGGEYFPQFGFGWTNGVILKFLDKHQSLLRD